MRFADDMLCLLTSSFAYAYSFVECLALPRTLLRCLCISEDGNHSALTMESRD